MSIRMHFLALTILTATAFAADFHRTVPLDAKGRVSLDNYKGRIVVSTWDKPEFECDVHLEADGSSSRDREMLDGTRIDFDASSGSIRVKTRYPKTGDWTLWGDSGNLPLATYRVRMPRTAELRVKDYKSQIEIDGLSAALDLDTYKGEVRVRRQDGPLHLQTYKGDVRLDFARFEHRAALDSYRGTFDITMPRDAKFEIDSDVSRRGTLDTAFPVTTGGGVRRRSTGAHGFRATVNGGGAVLTLKGYRPEFRIR